MKKNNWIPALFAMITLMGGTLIYVFFRNPPVILSKLISFFGLSNQIEQWSQAFEGLYPPKWVLYNLPDMLWMISFMLVILIIWDFRWKRITRIWIISCFSLALIYEILQTTKWVSGHFDFMDLLFIGVGAGIAILFIPLKKIRFNHD